METNTAPTAFEKANLSEAENGHNGVMTDKTDGVAPEVTLESFAHLDEKKILRKVRTTTPLLGPQLTEVDGYPFDSHAGCPVPAIIPRQR